jgi:hypothetical protein
MSAPAPSGASEVRPYLRRLLLSIAVGIVVMATTAVLAYRAYGGRLADAPPLPSGSPPLSSVPVTSR